MTTRIRIFVFIGVIGIIASSSVPTAQSGNAAIAVAAADDPDFAAFVKKATTKPEFLSPLVDHLPKKAGVPSPKDVLGYHIGTEKKLTYVADQQRYFRALEKALPGRVKTEVVGKTEEGRDVMVAVCHLRGEPQESRDQSAEHQADRRPARLDRCRGAATDRRDQAALPHQRRPP